MTPHVFLRTCLHCKQPKDEDGFKKPGGWCADCRATYHTRLKELNERKRNRPQHSQVSPANGAPALGDAGGVHARAMVAGDPLVSLALQVGEAKGKAMTLGRNSSHGKRAWGVYYWLKGKLDEMMKENGE